MKFPGFIWVSLSMTPLTLIDHWSNSYRHMEINAKVSFPQLKIRFLPIAEQKSSWFLVQNLWRDTLVDGPVDFSIKDLLKSKDANFVSRDNACFQEKISCEPNQIKVPTPECRHDSRFSRTTKFPGEWLIVDQVNIYKIQAGLSGPHWAPIVLKHAQLKSETSPLPTEKRRVAIFYPENI